MPNTNRVAAMENTPSLNDSIREVLSDLGIGAILPVPELSCSAPSRTEQRPRAAVEALA
jgi:hypothetical protein